MLQHGVNICVFSRLLKPSLPRSESLKLSGREFQSDGSATSTEKARGPSVLSHQKTPSSESKMLPCMWHIHGSIFDPLSLVREFIEAVAFFTYPSSLYSFHKTLHSYN